MPRPKEYADKPRARGFVFESLHPIAAVASDLYVGKEALRVVGVRQAEADAGSRQDRVTTVENLVRATAATAALVRLVAPAANTDVALRISLPSGICCSADGSACAPPACLQRTSPDNSLRAFLPGPITDITAGASTAARSRPGHVGAEHVARGCSLASASAINH